MLFCSAVLLSEGRREGRAKAGVHSVCSWARLVALSEISGNSRYFALCSGF